MIPSELYLADLNELFPIALVAVGLTYVITGSKAGYPFRFITCFILLKLRLRYFWNLVTCPPCNAFWTAGGITLFLGYPLWQVIQLAFTTCGIVAVLQARLGGDGIGAGEDFADLFGVEEKNDGQ